MSRNTMVVYRKSKGQVVTRMPAHMMSIDDAGRIHGRDNMYLVLSAESGQTALAEWKSGAKTATAVKRRALADDLEPRGLKIARYGENGDAVVMWDDEFRQSDIWRDYVSRLDADRRRREELEAKTVTISLVTRGWGDYGMVEWRGDITRPTAEIVAECRAKLERDTEKDRDITDAEIAKEVADAKAAWAAKNAKRKVAAAHVEECKRRARETGERVKIESWVTNRCHNGNDDQCSFDDAVRWAMPDGTEKITYTCCF